MVIDDDALFATSVKRMLERQGYTVVTHDGGPGCCMAADAFEADLVLVDVKMPFLSGDAFVWLFRPRPGMCNASIVLYSGLDEVTLKRKAEECGAHGYISKSESPLEFARKVAGYIRSSQRSIKLYGAEPPQ